MKQTLTLMSGNSFHVISIIVRCLYCISAGHVTIDIGELSDGQEKQENKKSAGPG